MRVLIVVLVRLGPDHVWTSFSDKKGDWLVTCNDDTPRAAVDAAIADIDATIPPVIPNGTWGVEVDEEHIDEMRVIREEIDDLERGRTVHRGRR